MPALDSLTGLLCFVLGDAHDLKEQPQPLDGLDEPLVVHRLGDVDAAPQLVAALDLAGSSVVVSMMTGISAVCGFGLDLAEHLHAVDPRHLDVEQEQDRLMPVLRPAKVPSAAEEVQGLLAVLEALEAVGQPGPFQVALDQAGMAVVVFGEHDQERFGAIADDLLL